MRSGFVCYIQVSDVPLMAGFLQLSELDWKYKTEPQGNACLGKCPMIMMSMSCI